MVTEISPIFGLTFMGIMEILTMLAGFGSIVVAAAILYTHRGQKKIASANLVYKYKGAWRTDKDFTDFLDKIKDPDVEVDLKNDPVYSTIDHFEDIAILWHEKVLDFNQVKEFFGTDLANINHNASMKRVIDELHQKNIKQYYVHLKDLLEKIDW